MAKTETQGSVAPGADVKTIVRQTEDGQWVEGNTDLVTKADAQGYGLSALIDAIPSGGGDEMIFLRAILQAKTPSEVDAAWSELGNLGDFFDKRIRVNAVKKMPSKFAQGLGWYFVLDITDAVTGADYVVGTGATSVMAQIIKMYSLGAIPFECVPRNVLLSNGSGYSAQHLEIVPATFASGV